MTPWLELPASFKLVAGGAAQGSVVAGAKLKKVRGLGDLAEVKVLCRKSSVLFTLFSSSL